MDVAEKYLKTEKQGDNFQQEERAHSQEIH